MVLTQYRGYPTVAAGTPGYHDRPSYQDMLYRVPLPVILWRHHYWHTCYTHLQTFRFIFFFGDAGRSGSGAGCSGITGRVWAAGAATADCVWDDNDDNEVKLVGGMDIELERVEDCTGATVWWEVVEEATSNTFVVSDTWTMAPSETFGREIIWETNNQHRFIPDKWYKKRLASTLKNSKNPSNPVFDDTMIEIQWKISKQLKLSGLWSNHQWWAHCLKNSFRIDQ